MIRLPAPAEAGTTVLLRATATDGRRAGALLDGPVVLEVTEAEVPLVPWEELGLRALGGQVTYRTTATIPEVAGRRAVLDLGEVRGTLAGYLDDASPTRGVYAGQVRTGLLGPVLLRLHAPAATNA